MEIAELLKQLLIDLQSVFRKNNKDLPWWVELLFVQIGLPDKLLLKILKAKKKSIELIKNDKKCSEHDFKMI